MKNKENVLQFSNKKGLVEVSVLYIEILNKFKKGIVNTKEGSLNNFG